ncbi:MAG TPA: Fe-S cluster assembly protein SufD [Flavobacteriales bacterium]|jgi:Fe-S cluster assembly protein SufD|nr:Fe-S cluster assembly protein SufD [Salibacteraceae bacterium]HAS36894.1 Fe-S cluster assembly protein SufD [Flavobacteriales bacterium]
MSRLLEQKEDFLREIGQNLNGANRSVFEGLRSSGEEQLSKLLPPSTKEEYWKYTKLTKILKGTYSPQQPVIMEFLGESDEQNYIRNWEDMEAEEIASLPKLGVTDRKEEHFFDALNAARFSDGFCVYAEGDAARFEVYENFRGPGSVSQKRNLVVVKKGASLKLIHRLKGAARGAFANNLTEVYVEEGAHFEYIMIQDVQGLSQIGSIYVEQKSNSVVRFHTASLSGDLNRNNLNIRVNGENCESYLDGISLGVNANHIDHHTIVDHMQPNCMSSENYKGIFYDQSRGVFNGKVFVRQLAQKTNAFQSNQNILMSDNSSVDSKPELEIYADDVKCSHGSTTGQFDEEAVFYLRSRGIGEDSARQLLVQAFLAEITEAIQDEEARDELLSLLDLKIGSE